MAGGGVEAWLLQAVRPARTAATATSSVSAKWGRAFMSNIAMYSPNPSRFLFARKTRIRSRFPGFQRRCLTRHEISCRQRSPPPDSRLLHPPSVQLRLTSVRPTTFAVDIVGALKGVIVARGCQSSGRGGVGERSLRCDMTASYVTTALLQNRGRGRVARSEPITGL